MQAQVKSTMVNAEDIFSDEEMLFVLLLCLCLRYAGLHG